MRAAAGLAPGENRPSARKRLPVDNRLVVVADDDPFGFRFAEPAVSLGDCTVADRMILTVAVTAAREVAGIGRVLQDHLHGIEPPASNPAARRYDALIVEPVGDVQHGAAFLDKLPENAPDHPHLTGITQDKALVLPFALNPVGIGRR